MHVTANICPCGLVLGGTQSWFIFTGSVGSRLLKAVFQSCSQVESAQFWNCFCDANAQKAQNPRGVCFRAAVPSVESFCMEAVNVMKHLPSVLEVSLNVPYSSLKCKAS